MNLKKINETSYKIVLTIFRENFRPWLNILVLICEFAITFMFHNGTNH